MKKIELYKDDEILLTLETADYEINTYTNSFEIVCHDGYDRTYSIPLNKGYKITIDI